MANLADLLGDRNTAGAAYAAALATLRSTYVTLFAIEQALNSGGPRVLTFRGDFDQIPWEMRHPEFAPGTGVSIVDDSRAAGQTVHSTLDGVPRE